MLEGITIWKVGELVIAGLLGWIWFVIRTQNAKTSEQDARVTSLEDKVYQMQTKFVTDDQMNSKLDPIHEDMREIKRDIKTLLANSGRGG